MPELDRLKEETAYLKFWQGLVVVTDISLAGWLIAAVDHADLFRVMLAVVGIALLSFGAVALHREVARRMERIGKL